ncbi:GNAT family N-acetyltransferase [Deinococcus psychrotolerans]|uniref:GNAT family N-acetyltransferase n=1 Tax=Deinococcus psychrotolerans TaxID=2489213 RepID=A0A3G8Y8Q5_9DEIO|nr:GNAT family N-acetyltransferase [Deinococcus psychrotolerans]AZI41752.1 GNAT family N-acetyltransferase [Deinococcus psychrotolerans]
MDVKSLGYRTDLMLLRLCGSQLEEQSGHFTIRTPRNPGFWWGNFLLYKSLPASGEFERWQAEFRAAFPAAKHMTFGVDCTDGQLGEVAAEIEAAGFELAPNTVMTAGRADLRPPARPNMRGEYRKLTRDDDWAQALQLRLACNDTVKAQSYQIHAEERMREARRMAEAGHGGWFGAFVNGQMEAGMGLYTDGCGVARFQSVETRPEARGQGLASNLVHFAAQYGFEQMNAQTLVMVADPDYLAIRLYRAVGFKDTETQLGFEKRPA